MIDTTELRSVANSAIGNGGVMVATPEEVLALLDKLDGTESMFLAACAELGAINKLLGLDPDDGGAEPILYEVKRLLAIEAAVRSLDGRKVAAALGTAGRPAEMAGGKRSNIYLDAANREIAERIGNGNISEGIRIALAQAKDKL